MPDGGRRVPLRVILREWTRIGLIDFGGPPAHIALLRELVVERSGWMVSPSWPPSATIGRSPAGLALITTPAIATGGSAAIAWTALKVGALSFGAAS